MRLLIIDEAYPSDDNLYGDVFAHVRVKKYQEYGAEVLVVAQWGKNKPDYSYEGINVKCPGSVEEINNVIKEFQPNAILIHFATFPIIKSIIFKNNLPFIIWVHGFEALGWYRRLFNFKTLKDFLGYIKGNLIQLYYFKKLISLSNSGRKIHFVFVSEWMKKIAETDCLAKVKNFSIIPNPIDDKVFYFEKKPIEQRLKLLLIRPFNSKKYATDIVTDALIILSKKDWFHNLNISIYGKGSTKSKLFEYFKNYENVVITDKFLPQPEIKKLHLKHGVFLSPTRQDAQGVSMCEAMSSGLLTISSFNTAIPEFIQNNHSGLLINNTPQELAEKIEWIYKNPEEYSKIAQQGSKSIAKKAGIAIVVEEEISIIKEAMKI